MEKASARCLYALYSDINIEVAACAYVCVGREGYFQRIDESISRFMVRTVF
ncbi:hypothetical protein [Candidatus Anaplasma sp. TIGMIC]|uniref:hypothetical protein n=1 Tax=Candidatus Anaplasma sp. TIGMIC TaxID=3020713 RepID=UPI00232B7788|nr:hypothetical protein [Candidatus Anaplasma sp. TIGMIC]MDB1135607.1 hypothetical protein [Candidatus Anaplasma sp. TIGMIC]